jgi:hypothetical protein
MKDIDAPERNSKRYKRWAEMKAHSGIRIRSKRKRMYNITVSSDELYQLRYSVELSKVIGVRIISATRKRKLRLLAISLGKRYAKVSLSRTEVKLLFAHDCQHIIIGDTDLKQRTKFLKRYIGTQEAKRIEQQVAAYERLKAIHESEEMEDTWDFPEEDYDAYYNR